METDTLQEAQRQHEARLEEARRLGQDLTADVPVMDDDNLNALDEAIEAAKARQVARGPAASAPVSVRGRLALAREMLVRAEAELQAVAGARGVAGSWVIQARNHASEGLRCLDKELAD